MTEIDGNPVANSHTLLFTTGFLLLKISGNVRMLYISRNRKDRISVIRLQFKWKEGRYFVYYEST